MANMEADANVSGEPLPSLPTSKEDMDAMILRLTEEMEQLCPELGTSSQTQNASTFTLGRRGSGQSSLRPSIQSDTAGRRSLEETYRDIAERDAFLEEYLAYGDASLLILDDTDLADSEKIHRLDALGDPPRSSADEESKEMQSRITSLMTLAARQKSLPKEVTEERVKKASLRGRTKRVFLNGHPLPPPRPLLPSLASTRRDVVTPFSSHSVAGSGLNVQRQTLTQGGGMDIYAPKRPVVIRKKKHGEGARSPVRSPMLAGGVSSSAFALPSRETAVVSGESVDLFDEFDASSLILTESQNAQLEEILKSCIPDFPAVVSDLMDHH